jgi:hypothetical protein
MLNRGGSDIHELGRDSKSIGYLVAASNLKLG